MPSVKNTGTPERGHRLPERTQVLPVPRIGAVVVGVGRVKLDGVQAMFFNGVNGLGDDGIEFAGQAPLIDGSHRIDALWIDSDRLRLEDGIAAQHGIDVQQNLIDASIVHLGEQVVGGVFQVGQVGRIELLGEILAVNRPQHPSLVVVNAEVDVGQVVEVHGPTGSCQYIGRSRCAVADAPSGLVVRGLTALDPAQVISSSRVAGGGVGGREAVGVGVNNHGQYLGSRGRRLRELSHKFVGPIDDPKTVVSVEQEGAVVVKSGADGTVAIVALAR